MDLVNGGTIETRASLFAAGIIHMHVSCGTFWNNGDLFAIYAGGQDGSVPYVMSCQIAQMLVNQ